MCGLIGFISSEKYKNYKNRADFMYEGLVASMWRGSQSTGVALIGEDAYQKKETPLVYKDAISAYDFINRPFMDKTFSDANELYAMLGHTRAATNGSVSRRNAHPFQHGHITLMHNGHINNCHQLVPHEKRPSDVTVDSDMVAYAMANVPEGEDEEHVLEKLDGGYALIWHNAKDGTINMARNDRKPLQLAYIEKENTLCYASEYTLLVHLLERRDYDIDRTTHHLKPMNWYKFRIDDLRGVTSRPFVQRSTYRPPPLGNNDTRGTTTTTGTKFPQPTDSQMHKAHVDMLARGDLDLSSDNAIREYLRRAKKDIKRNSGHPATITTVKRAIEGLKAFSYRFGQEIRVIPTAFKPYKVSKLNIGKMYGTNAANPKHVIIMHNVPLERYEEYIKCRFAVVNVVNVSKKDKDSKDLEVVAVESPRHQSVFDEWAKNNSAVSEGSKSEIPPRTVFGPGERKVTEARWLELTKGGCSYCSSDLHIGDHVMLTWIDDRPICDECTNDPDFWDIVGQDKAGRLRNLEAWRAAVRRVQDDSLSIHNIMH